MFILLIELQIQSNDFSINFFKDKRLPKTTLEEQFTTSLAPLCLMTLSVTFQRFDAIINIICRCHWENSYFQFSDAV